MSAYKNNDKRNLITKEYLDECFTYEDGKLFWKVRPDHHFNSAAAAAGYNKRWAGHEALANLNSNHGYSQGSVKNVVLLRRWVIFVMFYNRAPNSSLKSFNGKKFDDRIENIFEANNRDFYEKKFCVTYGESPTLSKPIIEIIMNTDLS